MPRWEDALELVAESGAVYLADPPRVYEQLLAPRDGFLPLEAGTFRYDGTAARWASLAEFKKDVERSTCELSGGPPVPALESVLKWQKRVTMDA